MIDAALENCDELPRLQCAVDWPGLADNRQFQEGRPQGDPTPQAEPVYEELCGKTTAKSVAQTWVGAGLGRKNFDWKTLSCMKNFEWFMNCMTEHVHVTYLQPVSCSLELWSLDPWSQ